MTKPLMSVSFSDLFKYDTYAHYLKRAQPRSIMWLVGGEQLHKSGVPVTYELCPNSWVVLRLIAGEESFHTVHLDVEGEDSVPRRWEKMVQDHMPFIVDPKRTIVLGPFNEFLDWPRFDKLVQAEAEICARLWERWGLRSMIGNFSVGTPDTSFIPRYAPALRAANKYNGVLGLHQYMQVYASDLADWTTCRYRQFWPLWKKDPSTKVPVMTTETGVGDIWIYPDQVEILQQLTGGRRTPGWKLAGEAWKFRGETKPKEEVFFRELKNLDALHQQDPEVKADFIFLSSKEKRWKKDDPEVIMPELVEWIANGQPEQPPLQLMSLDPSVSLDGAPIPVEPDPPIPDPDPPSGPVDVTTNHAGRTRIRRGPGLHYDIVGHISPGETVTITQEAAANLGNDRSWCEVNVGDVEGFSAAWCIERT